MHPIWNLPVPGNSTPSKAVLFDDFMTYSGSATADASLWFETLAGTAPGTVASVDTAANGEILITSGTVSLESGIEPNGVGFAVPTEGKVLYFEARIKVADVDIADGEVFFGLATASDVTPAAGATNRIGFLKPGGDATLFSCIDATETSLGKDLTDATYARLSCQVTHGKAIFFVDLEDGNGPQKVGVATSGVPAGGTVLMPKLYVGFSAASAQTVTCDYVLFISDRA